MTAQNASMLIANSAADFGKVVRYHRQRTGLSQSGLADLAGIGKTSVFDIEKGKPTVRLATLMSALRTLNINLTLAGPLMAECAQAVKFDHGTATGER